MTAQSRGTGPNVPIGKPFRLQLLHDEGTTTPFVARVLAGLIELRDPCLEARVGRVAFPAARRRFDDEFMKLWNAFIDARRAMKAIAQAIADHEAELSTGSTVTFQPHGYTVSVDINGPLRQHATQFLDRLAFAVKQVQRVADQLDVDVGALYTRDDKFAKRLAKLEAAHPRLADYLVQVRRNWYSAFLKRRNEQEHHGWTLPDVDYRIGPGPRVEGLIEPEIDGVPVRRYTEEMFDRAATFAENTIAYAFRSGLKPPVTLLEVALTARHPDFPKRFRLGVVEPGTTEWVLTYRETEF